MGKGLKLPFGYLPGHWGLAGKTKEIAKAEYELEGYELEQRLVEINRDILSEDLYKHRVLEIDFKYKKSTEAEYHRELAKLIKDDKKRAIAMLELDYKEGLVEQLKYEKEMATLKGEPWVAVIKMDFQSGKPEEGNFELDWNDEFVKSLEASGYSAPKPDQVVNLWFMEVCRNVALETFDGLGEFTEDSEAALKGQSGELPKGRRAY